jgi:hypothetical protein
MTLITPGVPTHKLLVKLFDGAQHEAGELVRYNGKPNWKFEPLDEAGRAEWREQAADPARVLRENLRTQTIIRAPMSEAEKAQDMEIRRRSSEPIRIA